MTESAQSSVSSPLAPARWCVTGLAVFLWSLFRNATSGIGVQDEAWFVRVGQRLVEGDVLYRDISFEVTPLSAWLIQASFSCFGVDLTVVKLLVAACFALSTVICLRAAASDGAPRSSLWLMAGTLCALASPALESLYSPLAQLFFLAAWAVLRERRELSASRAIAAGTLVGLCFASKQNFGLLALGATLASQIVRNRSTARIRTIALLLAAFALTTALVLLPVALQGATTPFLDQGFIGKSVYTRHAAIPFAQGLAGLGDLLGGRTSWKDSVGQGWYSVFLLPLVAAMALAVRAVRDYRSGIAPQPIALAAFSAASLAGAYPRFDAVHVAYSVPWMVLAIAHAFRGGTRTTYSRLLRAALLLAIFSLAWLQFLPGARRLVSAEWKFSQFPHLRGALVEWQQEEKFARESEALSEAAAGRPIFILSTDASLYYLISGVENPTRYDYPLVTPFGQNGQQELSAALVDGRVRTACVDPRFTGPMAPMLLVSFIREEMTAGEDLGLCTLYHTRSTSPPPPLGAEPE